MADSLRLVNIVAFDTEGRAVIQPLKQWKLNYRERQASVEVQCGAYRRNYDLRTEVVAVASGESNRKVSLGKTLGRVALTGLLHGRHAASADLRWGGLDRDESQEIYLVMRDTSVIALEIDGDDLDDLLEVLPEDAKRDDAQERWDRLMKRIQAMVEDGPRVLDELEAERRALESEQAQIQPQADGGKTFDERNAARERAKEIGAKLSELAVVQRAVLYDLSMKGETQRLKSVNSAADTGRAIAKTPSPAPAVSSTPMPQASDNEAPVRPEPLRPKRGGFTATLVRIAVWILGAGAGGIFNIFLGLLLGFKALFLLPVTLIGGGWLGLRMLDALLRR